MPWLIRKLHSRFYSQEMKQKIYWSNANVAQLKDIEIHYSEDCWCVALSSDLVYVPQFRICRTSVGGYAVIDETDGDGQEQPSILYNIYPSFQEAYEVVQELITF